MITPQLHNHYAKALQMIKIADSILIEQAREIYLLPKDERKPHWDEHYPIKDALHECWELVNELIKELDKRPSVQQYNQHKQQLTAARNYILSLGGNPSILTFA